MEISLFIAGLGLLILAFRWRQKTVQLFEYLVTYYLRTIHPIRDAVGRSIPGPGWRFPNGHMTDKFLQGELCSKRWRRFGSVYQLWAGTTPEIVITTPEQVKHFYADSHAHVKSHASNAGWLFDKILGSCTGLVNGKCWRTMRMALEDAFCFHETKFSHAAVFNFASAYLQDLAKDGEQSVIIDPFQLLKPYPLFCSAEKIYGDMTAVEKQELWDLGIEHTALMRYVLAGGQYRYKSLRFVERHINMERQRFDKKWIDFNRSMYETRASSRLKQPLIVTLWEGILQDRFTYTEVLHTLTEILFANLDVTSHALSWLVILLAENPGIQSEVRNESLSVVHESCLLGAHALRKDTLLGMAFQESLRLKPFTAFSIPEASGEDKFFNGYRVPKNTSIIIDTGAINIGNPFWGENRECFFPERFRNIEKPELRYNFFAFGFGSRKCQGHYFAELLIKGFVALLLGGFELRTSTCAGKSGEPNGQVNEEWVPNVERPIVLHRLDTKAYIDRPI